MADEAISLRFNSPNTDFGLYRVESLKQEHQEHGFFDDLLQCDTLSPSIQSCLEEIHNLGMTPSGVQQVEPNKVKQSPISFSSLNLLNSYGARLKRSREVNPSDDAPISTKVSNRELSTEDVFRVAGARFIQSASNQPFDLYLSGVSDEETRDVELAGFLLAAAEKAGNGQFESANRLLGQCDYLSSSDGNPVQRVVYYFSEALRLKIDRETGRVPVNNKGFKTKQPYNIEEVAINPVLLALHEKIPFHQIIHFTGVQAIVDNVSEATKIHVIELGIKSGIRCIALMQALVAREERPLHHLKITAVGTTSKDLLQETGTRLTSFAQSINLPFSYKIVMVSEMSELKEDLFEIDSEESVIISAYFMLRTMLARQDQLESLMRLVARINPCLVVVIEVEANLNSPAFASRFIEALFHHSAFFDCLEACMGRDDRDRMVTESVYLGCGIRNILAAEGEERRSRSVVVGVWRGFFRRYGMVETELSVSSLYQANLMVERFSCGSCTLYLDGESLVVGWKGTPINSLSVWKFL